MTLMSNCCYVKDETKRLEGQAMSLEQLLPKFFYDPSQLGNRFDKGSPRSPDFRHDHTKEVLWIEGWLNPSWAELAAMIQGGPQSGDGPNVSVHHEAPTQECNRVAQLSQVPWVVGYETGDKFSASIIASAFRRGPREGINNSSGSCGDVRTLCKAGRLKEALHILNQPGILADSDTYVCILQECIKSKDLAAGRKVHAHIAQSGFKLNIFLLNTLVNMYAKCGSVADARQVFDKMPERDVFTWTIMMAGYANHRHGSESFKLYAQMQQEGVMPNPVTFICILKACASIRALGKGREVHGDIMRAGIAPYTNLENTLVDMYAKCGSMKDAREVFENMTKGDVVSWNTMIAGYAQHGCGRDAFEMYEKMIQEGVIPNKVTFICIVNACANLGDLEKGKEVHADITKAGIVPDIILATALVDMYAKCGSVKDARHEFDMVAKRNVVSWNAMIAGYVQHGYGMEALEIYEQMILEGVMPDIFTFTCVLNGCASVEALEKGKEVHANISRREIVPDIILENTLVDMYAKCGSIKDARQVFDNMAQHDVTSWNVMLTGYSLHGCCKEAFEMYGQMVPEGVTPNKVTFLCILNVCANLGSLVKGKQVHADIGKSGISIDISLENSLVDMYAKCGSIEDARKVFDSMAQQDVVSWNAMIAGYAQQGYGSEAIETYEKMIRDGVTPDRITFICVLNACTSIRDLGKGKEVHADIVKAGIAAYINLENTLLDMYFKCGSIKDACSVFDSMAERNVVSWSAMISGYAQRGCGKEAFGMYEQMMCEGVTPNKVTFICVLNLCASLAALKKGKELHAHIIEAGILSSINLENTLINMYAKCGNLEDAREVFDSMAEHDVVSWNVMITGYSQHGCGREALQLFEQMQQVGLKPTAITFISLLCACSHAGLLDEGCHYFDSMSRDHGIPPTLEHFGCMVDILGRGGQLDDAEDLINKMPIKPDASVWGALLGACRIHDNLKVAERAAKCLLKQDPQDAATYVLLSNIYAEAGSWDDKAKVRKMMEERGVQKSPERSCIEVGNQVH